MRRIPWLALALAFGMTLLASDSTHAVRPREDTKKSHPRAGDEKKAEDKGPMSSGTFEGLKFRALGPALTSGRVGDFAVDPTNPKRYFVAVSSGNVWKTENAGTTYEPIFDSYGSFSIGCLALDPNDPNVLWVGTGENNSQRSVAYGDGVYRSIDGGKSFENVGLENSEHIGMIAIDPRDSDRVFVAAQGPLWNEGGDRGLFLSEDGGATWEQVIEIDANTGVNEVHMDPRNPDVMYASTYQRRRHVWVLLNGGPGSGIYKSTDGGYTWDELTNGIPAVHKGRIGLDIAPSNPDIIYAIIEAQDDEGGFFRSTDAGASWNKMSDYMSTSPQYYNEIIVDPYDSDRVYSLNTFLNVTENGGKSFDRVPIDNKHVDDHALWIDPADTDHLLIGSDGGIYETWERGKTWEYRANLPVTQFYKIGIDNDFPFYNVYGGTQDNNTIGGPTRTNTKHGIHNYDWFITLGGDGFDPQIDPENPDIVYSQWQYGNLARYDRASGENQDIQPQPEAGEVLKWNWASALIISPHDPARLYYGANKLFRSDDRGDSWTRVSEDLTRQLDRNTLPVAGRIWSVDAVAKNRSTSFYGNIVSLDESPLQEGLLYVGTDDGLIQITEDGGANWKTEEKFSKVPEMSYVSSIKASLHEVNTVYATFDNHKKGDFTPYVLKSTNRGDGWKNISGDLPERGTVYSIVEDHVNPELLFVGTEFGVFFTVDGGKKWIQLKGGIPTIACRELEIQRRESDLVVATFGRGYYVLDDYSLLRGVSEDGFEAEATLYAVKDPWLFHSASPLGGSGKASQGDAFWVAENPAYGAVFSYYLKDGYQTLSEERREAEKDVAKEGGDNPYPTWDALRAEDEEVKPMVMLVVRDASGETVRRVDASASQGLHRVAWDLRYPAPNPARKDAWHAPNPWTHAPAGSPVLPGGYSVQLVKRVRGEFVELSERLDFEAKSLNLATLPAADQEAALAFRQKTSELRRAVMGAQRAMGEAQDRVAHLKVALKDTPDATPAMMDELVALEDRLRDLSTLMNGDHTVSSRSEPVTPGIAGRVGRVAWGWDNSAQPTTTHRQSLGVAEQQFTQEFMPGLRQILEQDLPAFEDKLEAMGAPWTPGRVPVYKG